MENPNVPEVTALKPEISEVGTLASVFFDPSAVFADMNRKPRFILALILMLVAVTVMNYVVISKIGFERILREGMDKSPAYQQLSEEQKEKAMAQQTSPVMTVVRNVAPPVFALVITVLGSLYYWGGANAMGGQSTFFKSISVWVYSSFAPFMVMFAANMIVAVFKASEDIEISSVQGGLFKANLGVFVDADGAAGALLSAVDLFAIWGWVLAAIGLQKTAKVSSGSAWGIVGLLALFGVAAKVIGALLFRG